MKDILKKLARAEEEFRDRDFLAPMVRGGQIHVRIAGVVCRLKPDPADFEGWGIFRPTSTNTARLVCRASLAERQRYLHALPKIRLILCSRENKFWRAIPAHRGDRRFHLEGTLPVRLTEEARLFQVIEAGFDGCQCWFDRIDTRHDSSRSAYLQQALIDMVEPDQLWKPGLTAEEREAYARNYWIKFQTDENARKDRVEERLKTTLAHAGAELRGYLEREDSYRVEFLVDGRQHVSVVNKNDMGVQVAGICLSGEDAHFDLSSLVGVLREADDDYVPRVGPDNGGMAENHYWEVHPRR